MSYLSERFPVNIAAGPVGGPTWSTELVVTASGEEQGNQNWSRSRHEYEVSQGIKTDEDFRAVGAHHRMARGRAHHFRFKDWSDYSATRSEGGFVLVTGTQYQIVKVYGSVSNFKEFRKITRLVSGTFQFWRDSVLTAITPDIETGLVTIAGVTESTVLECAFEFDVPVRYDTDKLLATLVHKNEGAGQQSLRSWTSVPLIERRE